MTKPYPANRWIYLDNNATTRVDSPVLKAMLPYFREHFANPSSAHTLGITAADALRTARRQVQALLGATHEQEILFTSGGTESNNAAILFALETQKCRNEIVTSTVEHPSVLALCAYLERVGRAKVHRIPVDQEGLLDLETYRSALSEKTAVVSMQWANNETGTIFPVETLAEMAHSVGALFHCDAVQAAGKLVQNLSITAIDLLSVSAHKLHGPKGAGALYVRKGLSFSPLIRGGHQERGRRAGTENTAAIVGFGKAAELASRALPCEMPRIAALRDRLEQELLRSIPAAMVVGSREHRLPNTLCIAFADIESDSILTLLNQSCIAASAGSACSSGSLEPSHVLRAMQLPFAYLRGAIRFSFSRENTLADIESVLEILPQVVSCLRAAAVSLEISYAEV